MLAKNIDSWFTGHEKTGLEKGLQQAGMNTPTLMLCQRFGAF